MRLEEFTTWLRSEVRNFDKFMRESHREDPETITLENTQDQWIRDFEEYIR